MNAEQKRLYDQLVQWHPDDPRSAFPFSKRLARENGWTTAHARRVIEEYKRFVFLARHAGHAVTPSDAVDQRGTCTLVTPGRTGKTCAKHPGPAAAPHAHAGRPAGRRQVRRSVWPHVAIVPRLFRGGAVRRHLAGAGDPVRTRALTSAGWMPGSTGWCPNLRGPRPPPGERC
jgi:hypothetical protein